MSLFECYDQMLKSLVDKHVPLAMVTIRSRPTAPWYDAGCVNVKEKHLAARAILSYAPYASCTDAWRSQLKYQCYYTQERYHEY